MPESAGAQAAAKDFEDDCDAFESELPNTYPTSHGLKDTNFDMTTSTKNITYQQEHLAATQHKKLAAVLEGFGASNVSCVLGVYRDKEQDIYKKAFPCTNKGCPFFKCQIEEVVDLGILECVTVSEWAFPPFMVPKKDGTARFVSNFCLQNDVIRDFLIHLQQHQKLTM